MWKSLFTIAIHSIRPQPCALYSRMNCITNHMYSGEWIGDTYVWPETSTVCCGLYLHTRDDLMQLMENEPLLMLGDSLSRRFAYTLNEIYKGTERIDYDLMSHGTVPIEYKHNLHVLFSYRPLFSHVLQYLEHEKLLNTIIISVADHYVGHESMWEPDILKLFHHINTTRLYLTHDIIFRTEPDPDSDTQVNKKISQMIYKWIHPFYILDHRRLAMPKSHGMLRDKGNSKEHYGPHVRLVLVESFAVFYHTRLQIIKRPSFFNEYI